MKTAMKKKKGLFTSDRIEPREEYKEGSPNPFFHRPPSDRAIHFRSCRTRRRTNVRRRRHPSLGPKGGGALPGVGEHSTTREKKAFAHNSLILLGRTILFSCSLLLQDAKTLSKIDYPMNELSFPRKTS